MKTKNNFTILDIGEIELLWEVPVRDGPIRGIVVHQGDIIIACARKIYRVHINELDEVTAAPVPSNYGGTI